MEPDDRPAILELCAAGAPARLAELSFIRSSTGRRDATLFDHQNWRQCALKALGQRDFEALTSDYYDADDPRLLDFIMRHILPRRGIAAQRDEVLLTLGAQNALWLAAQVLLTRERTAAIENPCYPGLREILDQTRCKVVAVDVDKDGLPPDGLPIGVDVVFCTPGRHCPTGAAMPAGRRRALLERAADDGMIVVEDDYEFEMPYGAPPFPALKSRDRIGAVVYIGSFSKSLFPGLRLGYLAGAPDFIREARALRAFDLASPARPCAAQCLLLSVAGPLRCADEPHGSCIWRAPSTHVGGNPRLRADHGCRQ